MINSEPLISWICVTYGRDKLLEELLYMFLNQTYKNKELIIVNDHPQINYVFNSPNVRIFNIKKRFNSLGEKRDYSKTLSNGDFIFFTDDDDVYYREHTKRLVDFHMINLDYDIVKNKFSHYSLNNVILNHNAKNIFFSGMCIKKEFVLNNSFGNKNAGEDVFFLKGGRVKHIYDDKTTHHYRWGMNVRHISGGGEKNNKKNLNDIFTLNLNKNLIVNLVPQLSELTKEYYFNF